MKPLPDEPYELDSIPLPHDYDDHFIEIGEVSAETRARLRRVVRVFVTLSDQEQDLVTQEIEQECR